MTSTVYVYCIYCIETLHDQMHLRWPSGPFSSSQPGPWPSGPFSSSPLLDASSSAPWSGVSDLLKLTALYTISEFN